MPGIQDRQRTIERRVRESWRIRACTAGLCVGVQVFLFGCGIAMPIALNGAWLAALCAPALAAAAAWRCRRVLSRGGKSGRLHRALALLLAATLLVCAAFAVSALVVFAEQTLLEQGKTTWSALLAVFAALLCALGGGTGAARLCFALRWAMALLIAVLALSALPLRVPVGLFPLLGAGAQRVGIAAACMLGSAAPALLLLLPPPELVSAGGEALDCPAPGAGFFVRRVLAGALGGAALVFLSCVGTTYEAIAESGEWGARLQLLAAYTPHEGLAQMGLTVLEAIAMELLAVNMLCAAEQALCLALPGMKRGRMGLVLLALLLGVCLGVLIVYGFEGALYAAPGLLVPVLALLALYRRAGDAC